MTFEYLFKTLFIKDSTEAFGTLVTLPLVFLDINPAEVINKNTPHSLEMIINIVILGIVNWIARIAYQLANPIVILLKSWIQAKINKILRRPLTTPVPGLDETLDASKPKE